MTNREYFDITVAQVKYLDTFMTTMKVEPTIIEKSLHDALNTFIRVYKNIMDTNFYDLRNKRAASGKPLYEYSNGFYVCHYDNIAVTNDADEGFKVYTVNADKLLITPTFDIMDLVESNTCFSKNDSYDYPEFAMVAYYFNAYGGWDYEIKETV